MENLDPAPRSLYDLIRSETSSNFEERFTEYKRETSEAVQKFVIDTGKKIKTVGTDVEFVRSSLSSEVENLRASVGVDIANLHKALSKEISALAGVLDKIPWPDPGAAAATPTASPLRDGGLFVGLGLGSAQQHRGTTRDSHWSPPVGGNHSDRQFLASTSNTQNSCTHTDAPVPGHRIDLPQFDEANPKLWQRRCEEYFRRWRTPEASQVSAASSLFVGAAATWLESYLQHDQNSRWSEFVEAVLTRFSRNQHTILAR